MPHKNTKSYQLKKNTMDRIKTPKTPSKHSYIDLTKYNEQYEIIEKIGCGDYYDVYVVKNKYTNTDYNEYANTNCKEYTNRNCKEYKSNSFLDTKFQIPNCKSNSFEDTKFQIPNCKNDIVKDKNNNFNTNNDNHLSVKDGRLNTLGSLITSNSSNSTINNDCFRTPEFLNSKIKRCNYEVSNFEKFNLKPLKFPDKNKCNNEEILKKKCISSLENIFTESNTEKFTKLQDNTNENKKLQNYSNLLQNNLLENTNENKKLQNEDNLYQNISLENITEDKKLQNDSNLLQNIILENTNESTKLQNDGLKSKNNDVSIKSKNNNNLSQRNIDNIFDLSADNSHNNLFSKSVIKSTTKSKNYLPFYRNSFSSSKPSSSKLNILPSKINYCISSNLTCIKILTKKIKDFGHTREVEILKKLQNHPNILKIINYSLINNLTIETVFYGLGTLQTLITKVYNDENSKFTIKLIYKIMYELSSALCYVHKKNIIHMDLKPENIFIQSFYTECNLKPKNLKNSDNIKKFKNAKDDKKNFKNAKNDKNTDDIKNCNNDFDIKNCKNDFDIKNCKNDFDKNFNSQNINDTKDYKLTKDNYNPKIDDSCNCYSRFLDDIKSDIHINFTFIIGDFNISIFDTDDMDDDGDKKYMPPEILLNHACGASDIYSLGLIFLELLVGIELPIKGSQWTELRKNSFGKIKWKGVSKNDRSMCVEMIDKNCKKRVEVEKVKTYFEKKYKNIEDNKR